MVFRPVSKNALTWHWICTREIILNEDNDIVLRAKAGFAARSFKVLQGVDCDETMAPVVKRTLLRVFLSLLAHFDLELRQMDVFTAFLNGHLNGEQSAEVSDDMDCHGRAVSVC